PDRSSDLYRLGKHFLMRWAQQHVCTLAVLEAEKVVTVFGPPIRKFIRLARQQCWEKQLLATDSIHFFADYVLDLAQGTKSQRQPGINARCGTSQITCAN